MADEDKNKDKSTEGASTAEDPAAKRLRAGTLNTLEPDFLSRKIGTGVAKNVDATLGDMLKSAYGTSATKRTKEFVGIVMRVVPQPYLITPALGPYYKILAYEAHKQGVEFALQAAQKLVLVQVRVPELDSMIPDPPIYDVGLQLSNKQPSEYTDEERLSVELIERHTTFVGWGAEGAQIPPVGSYVRVTYSNVQNRTGGRYLGIVMSPDGIIPSIGQMAADAFGACNGDLADHPTGIPRGATNGVIPVTPAPTEKEKLEKKLTRLKRKKEEETEASVKAKLDERIREVEAQIAGLPKPTKESEVKPVVPPPPPRTNCVQMLGGFGGGAFGGAAPPGVNHPAPNNPAVRPDDTSPIKPSGKYASGDRAAVLTMLDAAFTQFGVTNRYMKIAICGVIGKESGFVPQQEMGYSRASNARCREIFEDRLAGVSDSELTKLKANKEDFFNYVYGPKFYKKRAGHTDPGDGFKYRGRGLNQITFKNTYKRYGDKIGMDLVTNPDLMLQPEAAAKVAVLFLTTALNQGIALAKNKPHKFGPGSKNPTNVVDWNFTSQQEANIALARANAGWGRTTSNSSIIRAINHTNEHSHKFT